jgi:hypothetical protein
MDTDSFPIDDLISKFSSTSSIKAGNIALEALVEFIKNVSVKHWKRLIDRNKDGLLFRICTLLNLIVTSVEPFEGK